MRNKVYRDLVNDKVVKVTDHFEDIIILDGRTKIKTNQLLNPRLYEEHIDPNSFFTNESFINNFANTLRSIPLDDFTKRQKAEDFYESDDVSSVDYTQIPYDPELEKEELLRKAQTVYNVNTNNLVKKQFDALKDIMGDDDDINSLPIPTQTSNNISIEETPTQQPQTQIIQEKRQTNLKMDPILEMFKNVKRNTSFKIDFTVENKIPRVDFIEMMEDSYNTSIIDFLAQEFTDEIISDPNIIKEKIKDKLTELVYPSVDKKRKSDD